MKNPTKEMRNLRSFRKTLPFKKEKYRLKK